LKCEKGSDVFIVVIEDIPGVNPSVAVTSEKKQTRVG
jgi:hypothetical protein